MDPVLEGAMMAKVFSSSNPFRRVEDTADNQALMRQYEELKAALRAAQEEIHDLNAVVEGAAQVQGALKRALQEANPDNPLVSPFDENPARTKIFDDAYYKALANPSL